MKCKYCKSKTKVLNTRVRGNNLIRYRICDVCNKKMETIELDMSRYHNEVFTRKQINGLMKIIEE